MNQKELIITRVFNAPKEKVFMAWTSPRDAAGKLYWSGGEYLEVDEPNRLVIDDHFTDEAARQAMVKSGNTEGWNSSLDKLQALVEN